MKSDINDDEAVARHKDAVRRVTRGLANDNYLVCMANELMFMHDNIRVAVLLTTARLITFSMALITAWFCGLGLYQVAYWGFVHMTCTNILIWNRVPVRAVVTRMAIDCCSMTCILIACISSS